MATVRLLHQIELNQGDCLSVTDRERKMYTLKYEGVVGKNIHLKLMGRNTVRTLITEFDSVADFIHTTFRKAEKVLKF